MSTVRINRICRRWLSSVVNLLLSSALMISCVEKQVEVSGEFKQWHTLTFTFDGPATSEADGVNPFTDYRLVATFTHDERTYEVRGYYAADGNAAESGADSGAKWRVKFVPDAEGAWKYTLSFRQGDLIAINDDPQTGNSVGFDGEAGSFLVGPSDKSGRDFRAKGRLVHTEGRYFKFSGSGEYFLKGGAGSPENFLAYQGFDGTGIGGATADPNLPDHVANSRRRFDNSRNLLGTTLHEYPGHVADWREGDPDWQQGRGKGIIGAVNYLSSKGMNSVYFLTLNIEGDGDDVWPYSDHGERRRFDCSKLDQWDILFTHMEKQGLMLHIVTQETENQMLLDNGDTDIERKLYYRELIARFAHHLAVTWDMGEENGYANISPVAQNDQQRKDMIRYMKTHDPYKNPVVLHTHANPKYMYPILEALLGFEYFDAPSLQIFTPLDVHRETLNWIERSKASGVPWVANLDEIGPAGRGVDPDDRTDKNNQDSIRSFVLWGNLMAGGGGASWYFGFRSHNNDLGCEDWRSRDAMWDYTRHALEFFHHHLPFREMESADELMANTDGYCFAKRGELYVIYLPHGQTTTIDLTKDNTTFAVHWYNPRTGGDLREGSLREVAGGGVSGVGFPEADPNSDWVVLLTKK